MKKGLVSVITPTYNHELFLASCLDSIIAQSYPNWEVIIVDDGSTDKTAEIGRAYASKYDQISYNYQENIGPYRLHETYNKALSMANGEFIAILEGDDLWEPKKLELQIEKLNSNDDYVLSWGRAKSVYADTLEVIREHPTPEKDRSLFSNDPNGIILKQLYIDNCIPALTIVFRSEALRSIGGFKNLENLPLVDYPTLLELSLSGPFVYVDEFLGSWRMYPQQVTKTHTVNIRTGLQSYAEKHYHERVKGSHPIAEVLNWSAITDRMKAQLIVAYARSGRYKLIHKQYKEARKDYWSAITTGGLIEPMWKLRAGVGFVFGLFHLNVEGLAKLLNRTSYRK